MELKTRNVNTAFRELVHTFHHRESQLRKIPHSDCPIVRNETRNGPVLRIDEPVMVTYERPLERVLLNGARDANPFFHLYEALWMLAGRNDVAPLAYYASNMSNYSDDGKTLNGAYGYRWRKHEVKGTVFQGDQWNETYDQLDLLVSHLKADPTSRRAVLQMWNVEDDLLKIGANPDRSGNFYNDGLKFPPSKDVCCNLNVMFSLRSTSEPKTTEFKDGTTWTYLVKDGVVVNRSPSRVDEWCYTLDMTVTNRSNDMIWGMLGANYVHFTFLQEYMAARLGIEVGRYHHFTNNLHVYESNWKPEEWLAEDNYNHWPDTLYREQDRKQLSVVPLVKDPEAFERELPEFVEDNSGKLKDLEDRWTEPFLSTVAGPLLLAFACHKERDYHSAFTAVDMIAADDWRIAARGWIERRYKNWEGKK